MRTFSFLLIILIAGIIAFSNEGIANDDSKLFETANQVSLIEPFKGVCAPRHSDPNDYVCVIIEGFKNCDKDSDCVIQ
jgi:hypothetical protein